MKPEVKDLISSLKSMRPIASDSASYLDSTSIAQMDAWRMLTSPSNIQTLLDHMEELEEQQKLWLEPTAEMAQAGLAEVQSMLDEWSESFINIPEDVTDEMASDMAVFTLQAMAGAK